MVQQEEGDVWGEKPCFFRAFLTANLVESRLLCAESVLNADVSALDSTTGGSTDELRLPLTGDTVLLSVAS